MAKENRKMQALSRRAMFDPTTVNSEERTVEVIFATDASVRMYGWDGPYDEILSLEPGHVRWGRMESGAPVLDNHKQYGKVSDIVLGVVERAWAEGGQGKAVLRFSKNENADRVFQDVKDGIIRNISVGYRVFKYQKTETEGEIPEFRAIDWEPNEISMVAVPADYKATVRSEGEGLNEVEILPNKEENENLTQNKQSRAMAENKEKAPAQEAKETAAAQLERSSAAESSAATVDAEKLRSEAIESERTRSAEIMDAVRKAGLGADFAEKLIKDGHSVDKARQMIIDEYAEKDPTKGIRGGASIEVGQEETDKRRHVMTQGLVLRAGRANTDGMDSELRAEAEKYRNDSLIDLAKDCLEREGVNTRGMDKMEIARRAISSSTSDFPVLLEGANRTVLLDAYNTAPDTWRQFCTTGSVSDFREWKRLKKGGLARLSEVDENAEYKTKKINDGVAESVQVKTFGDIINVSRKMIVNDDLGAFLSLSADLGRAAARNIEQDVYSLFAQNSGNGPTMGDGNPLFHSSHNNIATGAALTHASIDAMRVLMAQQKDVGENDFLDLRPQTLIVPITIGSQARLVNSSEFDTDAIDGTNKNNKHMKPNVVNGLFSNIVDTPRLSGNAYYALAGQVDAPVFEVSFLNGVQTPHLESRETFGVDGMQWKIRFDYGATAIDWRGIVKNPGA